MSTVLELLLLIAGFFGMLTLIIWIAKKAAPKPKEKHGKKL